MRRVSDAEIAEGLRLVRSCRGGGPDYWEKGALANAACRNYESALAELQAVRPVVAAALAYEAAHAVCREDRGAGDRLRREARALRAAGYTGEEASDGD